MKENRRAIVLGLISAFAALSMLLHGRIPQDPGYHFFADTRTFFGVPNFWNVASNLPFLLVGLYGLARSRRVKEPGSRPGYLALSLGVLLVSFGSGYYHYEPSTPALLWDRLPMTVAFMALFSLLLDERTLPAKSKTLWPLLIAGVASALYWYWSETRGAGDLRAYALVQFLPLLLIPAILLMYERRHLNGRRLGAALALYAAAKLFERFDRQVFSSCPLSGHTIKHLVAGGAVLCIILSVPVAEAKHVSRS